MKRVSRNHNQTNVAKARALCQSVANLALLRSWSELCAHSFAAPRGQIARFGKLGPMKRKLGRELLLISLPLLAIFEQGRWPVIVKVPVPNR